MDEAKGIANAEGVTANRLINAAIAEKISALRTEEYFSERAARSDFKKGAAGTRACRRGQAAAS
jgi:hypothetical protein